MTAVCSLCGREAEVSPLGQSKTFYDLCDGCTRDIGVRNPGLKLSDLTQKEKQGLRQAGEIFLALMEDHP